MLMTERMKMQLECFSVPAYSPVSRPVHGYNLRQSCRHNRHTTHVIRASQQRSREAVETSQLPEELSTPEAGPSSVEKDKPQVQEEDKLSDTEIQELAKARRQLAKESKLGVLEGVLEETRLISWPSPMQALRDTFTVVGIVAASAVLLFGLNTMLTEGSRIVYSQLGR